jgi:hypothetical protein
MKERNRTEREKKKKKTKGKRKERKAKKGQEVLGKLIAYFPLIRHGPQRRRPAQQFCCSVCIRCRGNVFSEPFPSNAMGIQIDT